MSIITETDFELNDLIGIEFSNDDGETSERLQVCIDKYEPIFLEELFGYEFARDLLAYVDDIAAIANPIFDAIIQGEEFTDGCDLLQKFKGIKLSITHYVYRYWRKENATNATENGDVLQGVEATSKHTSSAPRLVEVWNQMVKNNIKCYEYIESDVQNYPSVLAYVEAPSSNDAVYNLTHTINEYGI